MQITIDFTPAIQKHAGIGRYTEELIRALLCIQPECKLKLFYNDWERRRPSPPLDNLPCIKLYLPNKLWRLAVLFCSYLHLPLNTIVKSSALFHATDHLLPPLKQICSVFTLHDLSFLTHPDTHLPLNRYFSQLMINCFLQSADRIITVSECTKVDAIRLCGIEEEKITVIYEGVNPDFYPVPPEITSAIRYHYNLPERYILFVGTIEPRKNLHFLLEVFQRLPNRKNNLKLVMVGKKGWRYEDFFQKLKELGLENDIVFLGYIPDSDLPAIYSMAEVFVFPSLYEGFGLPVLEAMACGTPVICSNTSSLPEVAGEAALLLPPDNISEWIHALEHLLESKELRRDLSQRGLRQAARFTWHNTAFKTYKIYEEVYANCH